MVDIIQADRDAAADLGSFLLQDVLPAAILERCIELMRQGRADTERAVQAFARHRLAAQTPPNGGEVGELVGKLRRKAGRFVSRKGFHGHEEYFVNPDGPEAADALTSLQAQATVYRDIFAEITAKAAPLCEDENDPERITGYQLPVGPLHRAAGRVSFQMFDGERHLTQAVDRVNVLQARVEQLEAALTPSGDTKADYHGEFSFIIKQAQEDEDGEAIEVDHRVYVPWTTIKEIMAAIRARTALSPTTGEGKYGDGPSGGGK